MWSAGQYLDLLVRHQLKTDYYIFSVNGLLPLFFALVLTIFLMNITTIYSLFKPHFLGFYTALGSLAGGLILSAIGLMLALDNLPAVRGAYEASRIVRGLTVREEVLDMIFTPQGMIYSLASVAVFYVIVLFFTLRNRRYFYSAGISA